MPATPWSELTATETPWAEGIPVFVGDAVILFDIVMPVVDGWAFPDPTTAYTELSISATPSTELTVASTTWTELTG